MNKNRYENAVQKIGNLKCEFEKLKQENQELKDRYSRIVELLNIVPEFIEENRLEEYTVKYDETVCDGYCLMTDINIALDDIELPEVPNE